MTDGPYSAAFLIAVARVLASEGGYSTDSHDKGNWTGGSVNVGTLKGTKYGISAASYPDTDIAGLNEVGARAIYYVDYWLAIRGDELPVPVALVLFDAAVNQGVRTAIRFLQAALGVNQDGLLGPQTMTAARAQSDSVYLSSRILRRRIEAYSTLDEWPRYRASWVQRCLDIFRVAIEATHVS